MGEKLDGNQTETLGKFRVPARFFLAEYANSIYEQIKF